jgi:hypothetical protein
MATGILSASLDCKSPSAPRLAQRYRTPRGGFYFSLGRLPCARSIPAAFSKAAIRSRSLREPSSNSSEVCASSADFSLNFVGGDEIARLVTFDFCTK